MGSSAMPSTTSIPSTTTTIPSILSISISEKLTKMNYPLWRALVLPALRIAQFEGLLTSDDLPSTKQINVTNDDKTATSIENPAYIAWVARDQAILRYLLSSLTHKTLMHDSHCTTTTQEWTTLATLYSSQTQACSVNTKIALSTTKKNHLFVSYYYGKMCQYAYDLTLDGMPLRDDELVAYLLAGLDEEYNFVYTSVVGCTDSIAPSHLYSQVLSFEQHTSLQGQTSHGGALSAMATSRGGQIYSGGCGSGSSSRSIGSGRGHGHGRSTCGGSSSQSGRGSETTKNSNMPQCQVCLKFGHTAKKCWYRYEDDSSYEPCTASLSSSGDVNNNRYIDSGAIDHITGDLDKLTMHDPYCGNDQIQTTNRSGMDITCVGNSIIPTPTRNLTLNNVLHVPTSHKNLISVH
jgi:hypothetical protein